MQTADIAKSTQCRCERIWAADFARSAPLPLKWFFSTPAYRSTPAHAVFRSAHMLWTQRYDTIEEINVDSKAEYTA